MNKKAIVELYVLNTNEGGRNTALPNMNFSCPMKIIGINELSNHLFDCRLMIPSTLNRPIQLGETIKGLPIAFLSPDQVFEYLKVGAQFNLWGGKVFAHGVVTDIIDWDGTGAHNH